MLTVVSVVFQVVQSEVCKMSHCASGYVLLISPALRSALHTHTHTHMDTHTHRNTHTHTYTQHQHVCPCTHKNTQARPQPQTSTITYIYTCKYRLLKNPAHVH